MGPLGPSGAWLHEGQWAHETEPREVEWARWDSVTAAAWRATAMSNALKPETAVEMYLNEREGEVRPSTHQSHEYRLQHFLRWCEQQGIDDVGQLTGRLLHEYRLWRRDDGGLSPASVKGQMDTLRVFVRFCERIEAVDGDLAGKIHSPTLEGSDGVRDVMLEPEQAADVLDYLSRYHYASLEHVILHVLWRTGMRMGTLRALDLGDFDPVEERLEAVHRGEPSHAGITIEKVDGEWVETPLKNGEKGERFIAIRPDTVKLLEQWIENPRPEVTDEAGRDPLLTTTEGRISKNHLRYSVYKATRPCDYGNPCPHDRDPDECDAARNDRKQASKCPSSVSPHPIRRGSITEHLSDDIPQDIVSDRMDVTREILDKHYDQRSEERKVEQRRDYL